MSEPNPLPVLRSILSTNLPTYLHIYLSCKQISLATDQVITVCTYYQSIYLSIFLSVYLSIYLPTFLSICPMYPIYPSHPAIFPVYPIFSFFPIYPVYYLPICLSFYLPICLSVYLSFNQTSCNTCWFMYTYIYIYGNIFRGTRIHKTCVQIWAATAATWLPAWAIRSISMGTCSALVAGELGLVPLPLWQSVWPRENWSIFAFGYFGVTIFSGNPHVGAVQKQFPAHGLCCPQKVGVIIPGPKNQPTKV